MMRLPRKGASYKVVVARFSRMVVQTAILLFALCALGQSKFSVLYSFKGGHDAKAPTAAPILDGEGNLYGTGGGDVYKLSRNPNGTWTETVLHRWNAGIWGGLIVDLKGNLYGSTISGGKYNEGFAFELERTANWKGLSLYDFGSKSNDGRGLGFGAALLRLGTSAFYGAEVNTYELWQDTDRRWNEMVLYRFQVGTSDGWSPVGTLISDAQGNLYGATEFGGIHPCASGGDGCGTIYELAHELNGNWQEHILHRFARFTNDGELPMAGLVMDTKGNLYGTTAQGGSVHNQRQCFEGCGTVFELSPQPNGAWKETILYNFCQAEGCMDGAGGGQLVLDAAGNLYGLSGGGLGPCNGGCGMIFKLTHGTNGKWTHQILHRFSGPDGGDPQGLVLDNKGHLYGTAFWGGTYLYGVVWEITL